MMRIIHTHISFALCALMMGTGFGCAGTQEADARVETRPPENAKPIAPGPVAVDSTARQDDAPADLEAEPVRVFTESDAPPQRTDGRPVWWVDTHERDDGSVRFCVESIGGSIIEARRLAVARAQRGAERLADQKSGSRSTISFERIWIWPIRSTGGLNDSYAAFVMARVADNSDE